MTIKEAFESIREELDEHDSCRREGKTGGCKYLIREAINKAERAALESAKHPACAPSAYQAVWTTSGGTRIPVRDLSDEHLVNIINLLRRNASKAKQLAIGEMLVNPPFNGEMAQVCFDQEFDRLLAASLDEFIVSHRPVLRHLIAECERRGLRGQLDFIR